MTLQPMTRKCRAHNREGNPCGLYPIHGATVCQVHGGRAPQVKAAAERRVQDLYIKALKLIEHAMEDCDHPLLRAPAVNAAIKVVEYAEGKPKERVEAIVGGVFTLRIDRGDSDADGDA